MTYYDVLQVSQDASEEVIKAAYKSLAKKYHPDSGEVPDSSEFVKIEEAYQTLVDPEKRKKYDQQLSKNMESVDVISYHPASDVKDSRKKKHIKRINFGDFIETVISFLVLGLIVYSWFGNAEKLKADLMNKVGIQTFSTAEETCNVSFAFDYDKNFLKERSDVWINIDGNRVRLLAYGDNDKFTCKLSKGKHIVFVETKTLHVNSKKQIIQVEDDNQYFSFTLKGRTMWGVELYN